jgi:hypothetical protein
MSMTETALPAIPVIDIGAAPPVELVRRARPQAEALLAAARRQFTGTLVALGDWRAKQWLARAGNPYRADMDAIAAALGQRGIHGLNLSYEWACTSGVAPAPDGGGMVLRRTLDWPAHGTGRYAVVARKTAPAGPWLDVTWPGFVGVFTALAPGRFAAAINQAPLRRRTGFLPVDWIADRIKVGRSTALPPCHLLRRVFETCITYKAAKAALTGTPICLPALFILAGARAGEGCIIERTEDAAAVTEAPACVANHWLTDRFGPGAPRGYDSFGRQAGLSTCLYNPADPLAWVVPPVANPFTRLAAVLDANAGLTVQGWERHGPVTQILRLPAAPPSSTGRLQ